jgi:hypothetical protein
LVTTFNNHYLSYWNAMLDRIQGWKS